MKLPKLTFKKPNYILLSFLFPFLGMLGLMLVAGYIPFTNEKSMLYSDMWHQYYPFFKDFRRALLSGDGLMYNWGIGMGIDYLGLISYYLASPLNLLCVLVPESLTLHYFALLMPIKLGLAGLFYGLFLKGVFRKNDLSLPLFASFYALCGWALAYQWNVMWLDSFALLPLVALGTVRLLKDKSFVLYTVSLFFAIFINYYIGFFICIFVLLVFICYQICRCKSLQGFVSDLARIALFSLLAIGMTAILELPAIAALQTTYSSVNLFPDYFSLNIVDSALCADAQNAWNAYKTAKASGGSGLLGLWLTAVWESFPPILSGMKQVAGNLSGGIAPNFKDGAIPNLYCGVGTILFSFLFLTAKRVKLRDKICSVFLLLFLMVSFIVRQLDYIWHGFHFPNQIIARFSFLYSFVMLYMAYRAFLLRNTFRPWQLITGGVLSVGIILCAPNIKDSVFIVYNGLFFLLYFGILFFNNFEFPLPDKKDREVMRRICQERGMRRNYANGALALVMMLEIVMNVVNFGVSFPYTGITNYPHGTESAASIIRYMKEDDDLFFRAEVTHCQTLNDSALNGYNGISTFTSSANVKVTDFLKYLGFAGQNNWNRYSYEESSPVANLFLNLKYMIERDGRVEENPYFPLKHSYNNIHLLKNDAYLPLGFLTQPELADFELQNYGSAFALQNQMFSDATGLQEDVWYTDLTHMLAYNYGGTNVTNQTNTGHVSYQNGASATTLTYHYTIDREGFLCLDVDMSARNSFTVWLNNNFLYDESVVLPQTFSVCQVRPGDIVEVRVTCKANETGKTTIRPAILNDAVFRKGYEILAASQLELTDFSSTRVEGTISCNRDGLLYTSIPQNGNWSVTVDGKKTDLVLVGDVMCAVELTQGEHEIVFTYRNTAFYAGLAVSIVCLALFLFLVYNKYNVEIKQALSRFKK